ncbi:flippase (plasmid) [Lacticaseibacillus paracasei]|uniref:flippase n=1 Tax=Lacticaseibacillus paracasei TaxID=1597 RepID=UPI0021A4783E|nr:flippase [Lacticaseibacillus paracasei]UWP78349.1 flippase [Lacticaseibacillus paracasei]
MKIVKNYLYNVFYQVFVLIVPLITIPYVSRVLGATGVGINAFTNSNVQYFVLVGSIGVALYGNRQIAYVRDNREKTSQIFWEIFFMRGITIAGVLLSFFIFLHLTTRYHTAYLMQAILIIAAAFDISWFFMGLENFKVTVLRNVIIRLLSLVCIFMFVKTQHDLNLYIAILSLSTLIGNLTLFPYLRQFIDLPKWHELNLWRHVRPSMVLFIPQIASQVYLVLNKTMLGTFISVESSGYYDNSDKIIKMVLAIVTATGTVMLPRVANTFARGNLKQVRRYLYASFDFVSAVSIPMMFGIAAIAPRFAVMFFGPEFTAVGPLMMIESIVILMIAWSNVLGVQYLLPTGHNQAYTLSVITGAIVNVVLNIPLIMWLGTNGAMIATVLSELGVTIYQLVVVRKELTIQTLFSGIWKYLIAGVAMFAVVLYLNLTWSMSYLTLAAEIIIGMVIYVGILLGLRPKILQTVQEWRKNR